MFGSFASKAATRSSQGLPKLEPELFHWFGPESVIVTLSPDAPDPPEPPQAATAIVAATRPMPSATARRLDAVRAVLIFVPFKDMSPQATGFRPVGGVLS
jgi:hypothetical protein